MPAVRVGAVGAVRHPAGDLIEQALVLVVTVEPQRTPGLARVEQVEPVPHRAALSEQPLHLRGTGDRGDPHLALVIDDVDGGGAELQELDRGFADPAEHLPDIPGGAKLADHVEQLFEPGSPDVGELRRRGHPRSFTQAEADNQSTG